MKNRAAVFSIITVLLLLLVIFLTTGALTSRAASSADRTKHYESVLLERGDSIRSLADTYRDDEMQTYDDFVSDVCSVNSLSDPDTIHEGCYLLIPVYSAR